MQLRATTTFHLGQIERDITKGEVVEYDGTNLKLGDAKHNIAAIRGAVKAGWLVPTSDTTSVYRPSAAAVHVNPATPVGREKNTKFDTTAVVAENRDLGNLKAVRDRGDGSVRKMALVNEEASSEGVAVGKINRPTHMKATFDSNNETRLAQEVRRVDDVLGSPSPRVTPIRQASEVIVSGDLTGARTGDSDADLLGEGTVVARLPPVTGTNPLGEGDSPHLTQGEKDERKAANTAAIEAARAQRVAAANASAAKLGVGPAANVPADASHITSFAESSTRGEEVTEVLPSDLGQKVQFVRAVIPNFEWDMTRHWKTRGVEAVKKHGKNPLYMNGILSVETEAVKSYIAQLLTQKV